MEITDVRIKRVDGESRLKAIVSVVFDDEFVVHDIKIVEGERGLFIAMPGRKTSKGGFRDIAHPVSATARERIQTSILEKYEILIHPSDADAD